MELLAANEAYRQKVLQATGLHIKVGDNVLNGYPESFQRSQEELYRRCLAGESFVEHEPQLQANDAVNHCEISYNPIYDANGAITAVACFGKNITEILGNNALRKPMPTPLRENKSYNSLPAT